MDGRCCQVNSQSDACERTSTLNACGKSGVAFEVNLFCRLRKQNHWLDGERRKNITAILLKPE